MREQRPKSAPNGGAAAGFYSGVIRIRGAAQVHTGLVRVLNHELLHAALDAEASSVVFPGWLNEGLAEWFEARTLGKRHLNGGEIGALERGRRNGPRSRRASCPS